MRQTKVTTLRGTDGAKSDLGFNFGGGFGGGGFDFGFGGGLDLDFGFDSGFSFESSFGSGLDFTSSISGLQFQGGQLNVTSSFDAQRDLFNQLPTGLNSSNLPSLSLSDISPPSGGGEGEIGWKGLVAYLIAQGPKFIEAYRRGQVETPKDAPQGAKSRSKKERTKALLETIAGEDTGNAGGDVVAGLNGTQVALAAGVSAVAITLITQS